MQSGWKLTIEALGAVAGDLAEIASGEGLVRLMLQALGRELRELAAIPKSDSPRITARTLLLVAERAAKVAEAATGLHEVGDEQLRAASAGAIHLAQALAAGAQARATPLLPHLLDDELRANFAQAFAAHTGQIEALAAGLGPTA